MAKLPRVAVAANEVETAGKPIVCKAMVAHAPKEPLKVEMVTVAPPKAGEVRVEMLAKCNVTVE